MRVHLPTAEFAFLSACHIAKEGSVIDEELHPAAAVQYCGIPQRTMWAMVDEDGQGLPAVNIFRI